MSISYNEYFEKRKLKCMHCDCNKFKTIIKNKKWRCRDCGHIKTN